MTESFTFSYQPNKTFIKKSTIWKLSKIPLLRFYVKSFLADYDFKGSKTAILTILEDSNSNFLGISHLRKVWNVKNSKFRCDKMIKFAVLSGGASIWHKLISRKICEISSSNETTNSRNILVLWQVCSKGLVLTLDKIWCYLGDFEHYPRNKFLPFWKRLSKIVGFFQKLVFRVPMEAFCRRPSSWIGWKRTTNLRQSTPPTVLKGSIANALQTSQISQDFFTNKTILLICFDLRTTADSNSVSKKVTKNIRIFAKIEKSNSNFLIYPPGSAWQDLVFWKVHFSTFHLSYYSHFCDTLINSLRIEILLVIFTKRR